jgi:23S rRNA pseudouridine1911/1915/1917 synthase
MRKNSDNNNSQHTHNAREVSVKQEQTLLPFLFDLLKDQSRSSVKSLLKNGQILVNGKADRQFDTPLKEGDKVAISYEHGKPTFSNPLLNIVWEDDYLIVVNKREGLLSVSSDHVKERTASHLLRDYVKEIDSRNNIYVLHRLDRDTSGLMMFSKSVEAQHILRDDWSNMITQRTYVAVVEGCPEKEEDTLTSYLTENKKMQVYLTSADNGKIAVTHYKVLKSNGKYSLLQLDLETGRKNQIRVQMQSIGHPVAGDGKYGAMTDPAGRLMLHAMRLFFIHPITRQEMRFETKIPDKFTSLVR